MKRASRFIPLPIRYVLRTTRFTQGERHGRNKHYSCVFSFAAELRLK